MSNPHRASKYVPETSILKPADAALSSDDRPTFALTDAIVYRPDGVTMANALLINQDGPFVIRGRLEIEDEEDVEHCESRLASRGQRGTHSCRLPLYTIEY